MSDIPKIQDLYEDVESAKSNDALMVLLNQPPKESWVKIHPYIAGYKYLPINKVEFLLKKIFKKYRIEILREGTSFNGVYVVVRVHYLNPITNEFDYHDGIGAKELQVKKGASAADLSSINSGALAMAFPIAKTVAIKDACDHFGRLFGADLNRKDLINIKLDEELQSRGESMVSKINEKLKQPKKQAEKIITATAAEAFDVNDAEVLQAEILIPEPVHQLATPAPIVVQPEPPILNNAMAPDDDDF